MLAAIFAATLTQPDWPLTHAEATGYKETSSYLHVVNFLNDLQKVAPVRIQYIGNSDGGHAVPMAIASSPQVSSAQEAARMGRPVVYIQANIHAGEVEGKEAALALLRDWYRDDSDLLKKLIIIVVPIYNIDGNERWGDGRVKRRSQTGPDVIGDRTNGKDLDLNRDCIKAESPEMRAILSHVYNEWDPDVVFDLHTTDGTRHGYGLTYSTPLHPNTDPAILEYSRGEFIGRVRARLRSLGLESFDYGNTGPVDGATAWSTFGYEGRYVTNYGGLRNRITILSEAMSYSPFDERVRDTYSFVNTCLEEIAKDAKKIVAMSNAADQASAKLTRDKKELGVRFKLASRGVEEVLLEKAPTEGERDRFGKITEIAIAKMPIFDRFEAVMKAVVPDAYVVPSGEKAVIELLLRHGVVVERLTQNWNGETSVFTVTEVDEAKQTFQGHKLLRLEGTFGGGSTTVNSGDYIVRTTQSLGVLVFELLEPECLDGVSAWGFLSAKPEVGKTYLISKVKDASGMVTEIVTTIG